MSNYHSKRVTLEILKKGRKYWEVRYPGKNPFKLVINDLTKDLEVGQTVELLCSFEYKESGYSGKTYATAITEEEDKKQLGMAREAHTAAEIEKWCGYVEKSLAEGNIYSKGFDRLKELGFDTSIYNDRVEEIRAKYIADTIEAYSGYCLESAERGRDYHNGLQKLEQLGAKDLADNYRQMAREVRLQKEQEERKQAERKQLAELGVKTKDEVIEWGGDADWITVPQVGQVVNHKEQWVKVKKVHRRYFSEDGLSFGLADDSGTYVTITAIAATEEEAAAAQAIADEKAAAKKERQRQAKEREAIADLIKQEGDRPQHKVGLMLLETTDIYGGGDWFEISIADGEIWYCENNGRDGDDWSLNNVRTWGAGAIGWRVPYSSELAARIEALIPEQPPTEFVPQEEPPTNEIVPSDYAIAHDIAEAIKSSPDYYTSLWTPPDGDLVRVYVKTTGRKPKDCGWVQVKDGNVTTGLSRHAGTIRALYADLISQPVG